MTDKVTPIATPKRRSNGGRRKGSSAGSPATIDSEYWEKANLAYELKNSGKLPAEIAELLSIPDVDEVYQLIAQRFAYDSAYLDSRERKDILHQELVRLEKLQAACWPSAMMGDPKAIDSALKIIQTRARITGLEQVDPVVNKNLVLVMGEAEDDYIKALKQAGSD